MLGFFGGLILGLVIASVVWFFVWRNNKELFASKLSDFNNVVNGMKDTKTGQDLKAKFDQIFNKTIK